MDLIELSDLRLAVIASQHRSLRQAAEALNIRQSTLSRRLRDLEYRLDAALFVRTNGGIRTTIAGLEFIETARRILEDVEDQHLIADLEGPSFISRTVAPQINRRCS